MKNINLKHIKSFLLSLITCIVVFSVVLCLAIRPNNRNEHSVAKQNYPDIPYQTSETVFFIRTTELPICFLLKLLPKTKSFFISAIPLNSVKNSSIYLSNSENIEDFSAFLDTNINYIIELSNNDLSEIINYSNGIIAKTPYGVPSPVGNQLINDDNEIAKLFSGSVINLLCIKTQPNTELLKYQAYLMGLVVETFLNDISDEKYFLLKKCSDIDLSYASYYNNKDLIKECASSHETSFYDGVWIDNLYYLL